MERVNYCFRGMKPTEAIKDAAFDNCASIIEVLPEANFIRWVLGSEKNGQIKFAEIELHAPGVGTLVLRESNHDLYQAIHDVAQKVRNAVVKIQHTMLTKKRHPRSYPEAG